MPELFDLQCFISRSSKVKGEGRIQLPAYGFPIVPHSNYGSICYRLPTFAADRQTDRPTESKTYYWPTGQHKLANK